ncbi:hypothetical protein Vid5_gp56 [Pantoea phage vB_PagS_Vid5]|uniref:Uncharacterized protein n=1 Tax=Pantoea phage vB_PagS_Vid5 TaxID=2099652 RepID=A0A2P1CKM2_9CAUD|nr:hypothetical protein FDJ45_gp099 [Pantoea phage vB_PagS_Vid5]AVJ51811.1 hypothetical protein Vid5_gp56 [Pantoea phage vB_PagS_Vid5]
MPSSSKNTSGPLLNTASRLRIVAFTLNSYWRRCKPASSLSSSRNCYHLYLHLPDKNFLK